MSGVVGLYRIKNEERWIAESVQRTLDVVDKVIVLDDHSTDSTRKIVAAIPRATVVESPFTGLDEARDKDYLLAMALNTKPDWVVMLDGDEVLSRRAVEEIRPWLRQTKLSGILNFRIAYLWDTVKQERVDAVYGNFFRPRAYSLFNQTLTKFTYRRTVHGGNFHCGQIPEGLVGEHRNMKFPVKHYGYLHAADRERKWKWYNEKDPNNAAEGQYLHVIGKPNHIAPGPIKFFPYTDI